MSDKPLSGRLRARVATLREPPHNDIRTSLANYLESVEAEVALLESRLAQLEGVLRKESTDSCDMATRVNCAKALKPIESITGKRVEGA